MENKKPHLARVRETYLNALQTNEDLIPLAMLVVLPEGVGYLTQEWISMYFSENPEGKALVLEAIDKLRKYFEDL